MQTSRLRLRRCYAARVEQRPGRDGPGEMFALRNSPSKPENGFQALFEAHPNELHSNPSAFQQG